MHNLNSNDFDTLLVFFALCNKDKLNDYDILQIMSMRANVAEFPIQNENHFIIDMIKFSLAKSIEIIQRGFPVINRAQIRLVK